MHPSDFLSEHLLPLVLAHSVCQLRVLFTLANLEWRGLDETQQRDSARFGSFGCSIGLPIPFLLFFFSLVASSSLFFLSVFVSVFLSV